MIAITVRAGRLSSGGAGGAAGAAARSTRRFLGAAATPPTPAAATAATFDARESINRLLEKSDRSLYILAQYIPEPARDAFIAIRAFALEVNKLSDGGANARSTAARALAQLAATAGVLTLDVKFKFWSDLLARVFADPHSPQPVGEPVAVLLRDALRANLNLDLSFFHRFLQTRRHFLQTRTFASADALCAYGEGTHLQLNYATQALLLSPAILPTTIELLELALPEVRLLVAEIAAHIGQASAVAAMILGAEYYARARNQVTLPVDVMARHGLLQEAVLRLAQGHGGAAAGGADAADTREKLKSVVFDTAVTANDHILTARAKLGELAAQFGAVVAQNPHNARLSSYSKRWRRGVPDVVFTPFMVGTPTTLYLERLERYDFDVFDRRLQQREWKLAYRSYVNYYRRRI